jgi:hypothetical protein
MIDLSELNIYQICFVDSEAHYSNLHWHVLSCDDSLARDIWRDLTRAIATFMINKRKSSTATFRCYIRHCRTDNGSQQPHISPLGSCQWIHILHTLSQISSWPRKCGIGETVSISLFSVYNQSYIFRHSFRANFQNDGSPDLGGALELWRGIYQYVMQWMIINIFAQLVLLTDSERLSVFLFILSLVIYYLYYIGIWLG